jgi:CRP-like cAMP-binding protein
VHIDVIPVAEGIENLAVGLRIGGLEIAQRLIRKYDTPAEGVVRPIALDDRDIVSRIDPLHEQRQVEHGGTSSDADDTHDGLRLSSLNILAHEARPVPVRTTGRQGRCRADCRNEASGYLGSLQPCYPIAARDPRRLSCLVSHPKIKTQAFLSSLPLFNEVESVELDRIAAGTIELHVPRGEILFNKGDPCVGFHLVIYGQVKLAFISPQGSEKVVEIVGPGYSFGEALMFMEKPYIVMAQTLADSLLLHVSKEVVFDELERDPKLARKMLAGLSRRLHGLIADVESYSLQSGTQRVIGYLLRQDEDQAATNSAYAVTLPTSKAVVASRLNLTPEHFSRILHDLADDELISVDGREVKILDVAKLRGYSGSA